jgi:hypothetical protein
MARSRQLEHFTKCRGRVYLTRVRQFEHRAKTKKYRGVGYSYWHLCKTTRTARRPRQRVVASLGKLDAAQLAGLRGRWDDRPAFLRGETPSCRPATAQ